MSAQPSRPLASIDERSRVTPLDAVDEEIRKLVSRLVTEHSLNAVARKLCVTRTALTNYIDGHARRGTIVLIESQARPLLGRR